MAAKVALTAEEFRENSQRSIALFNTEKLSTDSTHVLKSAYCNSVHFCRCNLHGACGGKGLTAEPSEIPTMCCNLHGACGGKAAPEVAQRLRDSVAICTGRVEAKDLHAVGNILRRCCNLHGACGGKASIADFVARHNALQSARGVWRQSVFGLSRRPRVRCNLHGACGGKGRR